MDSPPDACPRCAGDPGTGAACARCGASTLLDLRVERPVADERTRFRAARDLAALALPGATFAALRQGLGDGEGVVAAALPRTAAAAAVAALARHGIAGRLTPAAAAVSIPPGARATRPRVWLVLAACLLVSGGAAFLSRRPRERREQAERAAEKAAAEDPVAAAASNPGEPAPAPRRLETAEVAARATASVAELRCGGHLGTGFFIGPERVATNAHVACADEEPVRVRLADGRELVGRTAHLDRRLDLAIVDVVGAAARALDVGDATRLAPGDPVTFIGSPHGLSATVHAAKVSAVGRNLHGRAYVQLDGNVNPGNSGGPLLDARGRLVGIVTLKVVGADGIGLALPVEYLLPYCPAHRAEPEAAGRWERILDRVRREDAREVEAYRGRFVRPALVAAAAAGRAVVGAVLVHRAAHPPGALGVTVDVRDGATTFCSAEASAREWEHAGASLERALHDAPDQPRLAWAAENHLLDDVYVARVALDVGRCELEMIPATAVLSVRGGEDAEAPVRFPRAELAERGAWTAAGEARRRRQQEEVAAQRAEESWRSAFRRLHGTIAWLEARRDALASQVGSANDQVGISRELRDVRSRLAAASRELDELERQASLQAVPREWRR